MKKRMLAMMLCLALVLGCTSMMAFAAETGSITVENQSGTNASVGGKTLNLFKIFEAKKSGENVSYQWIVEGGKNKYEDFFFGANGVILDGEGNHMLSGTIHDVVNYIKGLETDSFKFSQMAAQLYTYISTKGIGYTKTSDKINASATSYTFDGLGLGYYLIYDATVFEVGTPAVRSAAMLSHSGENKVIQLKADRPHVEKTVDDSDTATPDWKLGTTASIGDVETFKIATAIPNHNLYGDNYTFEIADKMDNTLQLLPETIKVTITKPATVDNDAETVNDVDSYASVYDEVKAGELTAEDAAAGIDFKVVMHDITQLPQDTVIIITYDAKVLNTATSSNKNTAILTYSNDPNKSDSVGSVEASASVLLWQFTLTKYMEDASGNASAIRLPGAEFQIFAANDTTTPLTFTMSTHERADGTTYEKYLYDPAGSVTTLKTINELDGDDGKTDIGYTDGGSIGQILIFGLGEGEYVIRETVAPDGYQIAKGDFKFKLVDGVGPTGVVGNAAITETRADSDRPGQFTRVSVQETSQKYYIGITNAPGSALPETGGMGTTLFTVIGIILMAGAVGFFTTRKRNSFAL